MSDDTKDEKSGDLKDVLRQLAAPVLASLDAKLKEEINERVERTVDETLVSRLDALEATVTALQQRVDELATRLGDA
jgi:hypothetical protein